MCNKLEQKTTINKATGLTPQQEQACVLLASGENYTAVAEALNINRGTLYRWLQLPTFECYYNSQCKEYQDEVKNSVLGLHQQAIATLTEAMTHGSESSRLRASIWILEKVATMKIGATDIRLVLQEQCSSGVFDFQLTQFNECAYKNKLKEYGLSEDT